MTYIPERFELPMGQGAATSVSIGVGPGEVRIIDPTTGGEKGSKLARFSLIPYDFLWALAEHYGRGSQKYADRNWEKGYKWSLSLDASQRHLAQYLKGERYDDETGSHHLVAAAWHLVALWWFDTHGKGTNDIATNLPTLPGRSLPLTGGSAGPGSGNMALR